MIERHPPSQFLRDVLAEAKVQHSSLLVLMVLAEYSTWANVAMTQTELARLCKLPLRSMRDLLRELVETRHIVVLHQGCGRGDKSKYHINVGGKPIDSHAIQMNQPLPSQH